MARVQLTANLQRFVTQPVASHIDGATVAQVLRNLFATQPGLGPYVLDEHGALRKHMVVFVDGQRVVDRQRLSDAVPPGGEVYVFQSLSGG